MRDEGEKGEDDSEQEPPAGWTQNDDGLWVPPERLAELGAVPQDSISRAVALERQLARLAIDGVQVGGIRPRTDPNSAQLGSLGAWALPRGVIDLHSTIGWCPRRHGVT